MRGQALREIVTREHARLFVPVSIAQFRCAEGACTLPALQQVQPGLLHGFKSCTPTLTITPCRQLLTMCTACSVYEALAAELVEPLGCACCTLDTESVAVLNDKIKFSAACERMGLRVPDSLDITSRKRLLELNERCGRACSKSVAVGTRFGK